MLPEVEPATSSRIFMLGHHYLPMLVLARIDDHQLFQVLHSEPLEVTMAVRWQLVTMSG